MSNSSTADILRKLSVIYLDRKNYFILYTSNKILEHWPSNNILRELMTSRKWTHRFKHYSIKSKLF